MAATAQMSFTAAFLYYCPRDRGVGEMFELEDDLQVGGWTEKEGDRIERSFREGLKRKEKEIFNAEERQSLFVSYFPF